MLSGPGPGGIRGALQSRCVPQGKLPLPPILVPHTLCICIFGWAMRGAFSAATDPIGTAYDIETRGPG